MKEDARRISWCGYGLSEREGGYVCKESYVLGYSSIGGVGREDDSRLGRDVKEAKVEEVFRSTCRWVLFCGIIRVVNPAWFKWEICQD